MTGFNDLLNADETGDVATPAPDAETEIAQDSLESVPVELEKTVPLKALESERGKRQGYETIVAQQQQQIDILMRTLQSQQPPAQQPPAQQPIDMLLDTEAWQNRLYGAIESIVTQQAFNRTLSLSEEIAREKHPDYDDLIETVFKPAALRQPELVQGLYKAANPANYAYKQAKKIKFESEEGELDYDKLKEKLRAELLAEMSGDKGELKKQARIQESLGNLNSGSTTPSRSIPAGGYRPKDLYD